MLMEVEYFVNTTHTVDYGVKSVEGEGSKTTVELQKAGVMPMPLDVMVTYSDGSEELFNIALRMMRGNKPSETEGLKYTILEDWPWTHPEYSFELPVSPDKISKIEIDPSGRLVDVDLSNNVWEK